MTRIISYLIMATALIIFAFTAFEAAAEEPPLPEFEDVVIEMGLKAVPTNTSTFGKPCVADWTEDGNLDVAWSVHKRKEIDTYHGQSDGTLNFFNSSQFIKHDSHGCVADDFDQDGDIDIFEPRGACSGNCWKRDALWLQDKQGRFIRKDWKIDTTTRNRSRDVAIADFDQNGWTDILISASGSSNGSTHQIIYNKGNNASDQWQGFESRDHGLDTASGDSTCAEAGDLNGDGWIDVIVCDKFGADVYHNDGTGKMVWQQEISNAQGIRIGTDRILVALGTSFEQWSLDLMTQVAPAIPTDFAYDADWIDFEGDGDPEILVTQQSRNHFVIMTDGVVVMVPMATRGGGDKVVPYTLPDGTQVALVGNGGKNPWTNKWDYKGPRQVFRLVQSS